MRALSTERGLTLIEMLISMLILAVALAAIYGLTAFVAREWILSRGQTDVQQNLRVLLDRLARDVRRSADARVKAIGVTPDAECPLASTGTQCLLLDAVSLLTADAGTRLALPAEICLEDAEGVTAGAMLTVVGPGKEEQGTVACTGGVCAGALVCPAGSTKVGFTIPLTYPRQRGELIVLPSVRYELDTAAGQVLRNGIPIAENVAAFAVTLPETTLTAAAGVGARTISVTSAAAFAVNDVIGVGRIDPASVCAVPLETVREVKEIRVITSIVGTTVTLDRPLVACHGVGRTVRGQVLRIEAGASRIAEGTQGQVTQTGTLAVRARLRN